MRSGIFAAVVAVAMMVGSTAAYATKVIITISKPSQKMTVVVDGEKKYTWPVSTGAAGYRTPSGQYRPFRMEPDHFSKEWDDAPMPHSIFFTGEGHAIHGSPHTRRLGQPVSHGCVRLAPANAAKLYALVQKAGMRNTTVIVKGGFDFGFAGLDEFDSPFPRKKFKKPRWMRDLDDIFRQR
jgi:lipoprotein-anchoring transpeptidase ErfK/SrfK